MTHKDVKSEKEPLYEVVSPLGQPVAKPVPCARPLDNLQGKKIGFVWNIFTNGDVLADSFTGLMRERFDDMKFVKLPSSKRGKWGEYPGPDFQDVVREAEVDAVIALVGG